MCTSVHVVSCDAGFGVVAACSYTAALGVSGGFPGHHVIASFGVHVWQGAVHFFWFWCRPACSFASILVGRTFPLSPPALVHLRHTMHAAPVVPLCGPSDKGLRADGVCGVLAPLHACHARCYVSCGIKHVQLLCLCCACDVGL